jgi:putative transposase
MKRKRFTDEQITFALRQAEGGTPVADVCRQLGVSEASRALKSLGGTVQAIPAASLWWNDRQLALFEGANIAGRGEKCSLVIEARTVSRRHARVTTFRGKASIEDFGSTNGTCVNGVLISAPAALADKDEAALGKSCSDSGRAIQTRRRPS